MRRNIRVSPTRIFSSPSQWNPMVRSVQVPSPFSSLWANAWLVPPATCAICHIYSKDSRSLLYSVPVSIHEGFVSANEEPNLQSFQLLILASSFCPLDFYYRRQKVIITLAAINNVGMDFRSDLGRRITQSTDDHRESAFLFQRLSMLIQRYNALAVLGTFIHTTPREWNIVVPVFVIVFIFSF